MKKRTTKSGQFEKQKLTNHEMNCVKGAGSNIVEEDAIGI